MGTILIALLLLYIALHVLDVWATYKCLQDPQHKELNKAVLWMIKNCGGVLPGLIIIKVFIISSAAVVCFYAPLPEVAVALACACVFYIWVVLNNVRILTTETGDNNNG